MRVRGARVVALAVCMVATAASGAAARQRTTAEDVETWIRHLERHQVGALDPAAMEISAWEWDRLNPVLAQLHRWAHPTVILRSAALLSDIAFEIPSRERPLANVAGGAVRASDGRVVGQGTLDGHLVAARRLLDALPRSGSLDAAQVRAHVVAWYRTVSATLAGLHNLADLEPHVKRALERFPDDAGILFDAGCFYEVFASPITQVPLAEQTDRVADVPGRVTVLEERSAAAMLVAAEKHFRQAAAADPAFAEAAIRLGHVLTRRGRAAEAVPILRRTAGLGPDAAAKYYGWMFYGAALGETGRPDEALQAFRSAAALVPGAQSPQLAISQVAADYGNATLARTALERAFAPGLDAGREDPWWMYLRGAGRDADAIRRGFVERMQTLPLPPDTWHVR